MADDIEAQMKGMIDAARAEGHLAPSDEHTPTPEPDPEPDVVVEDDGTGEGETPEPASDEEVVEPPVADDKKTKVETPIEDEEIDGTDPEALKKKAGKDRRIPHSEVSRIAGTRERKTVVAIAEKLGIPGIGNDRESYRRESFDSALDEYVKKNNAYRDFNTNWRETIYPVMKDHPEEFIAMLAKRVNPEYANFVRKGEEAPKVDEVDEKDDPRPGPDMIGADGKTKQYSEEGFQKLLEYHERRGARRAKAEIKKEFDERITPIEKERKARESFESDRETLNQIIDDTIAEASTWPAWKENEKAIQDVVLDPNGPYKDLLFPQKVRRAYNDIVIKKLTASYDDLYKKVTADIKKKAGSTSVTAETPIEKDDDTVKEKDDDPVLTQMKQSIAKARKRGLLR